MCKTIFPPPIETPMNPLRRHGRLSRKISFVVPRLSGVLKMDLFTLILCGVCLSSREPSLSKPGVALFPTRRSSQRGFRNTISHGYSTTSNAAVSQFRIQKCCLIYLSLVHLVRFPFRLDKVLGQLLFSVWCDVTLFNNSSATSCHACHWNAPLIPALSSWQLNKLQTISFVPFTHTPTAEQTSDTTRVLFSYTSEASEILQEEKQTRKY